MITRLNPNNLPPMVRERNKGLMTAFISAHLPSRVGLDTRGPWSSTTGIS